MIVVVVVVVVAAAAAVVVVVVVVVPDIELHTQTNPHVDAARSDECNKTLE